MQGSTPASGTMKYLVLIKQEINDCGELEREFKVVQARDIREASEQGQVFLMNPPEVKKKK